LQKSNSESEQARGPNPNYLRSLYLGCTPFRSLVTIPQLPFDSVKACVLLTDSSVSRHELCAIWNLSVLVLFSSLTAAVRTSEVRAMWCTRLYLSQFWNVYDVMLTCKHIYYSYYEWY